MATKSPIPSIFTRIATTCALPLISASVLVILLATLYPYTFEWGRIASVSALLDAVQGFFLRSSGADDRLNNILLFLPLGFGLASSILVRRFHIGWLLALFTCTGLSLLVESLQALLPSRAPTVLDVITNTLGGGLGIVVFLLLQHLCTTRLRFAITATAVVTFLLLLTAPLQRAAQLSNWDDAYSLSVGNDLTGSIPWSGTVQVLALSAATVSPDQLVRLSTSIQADATLPWLVQYDFTAPNPLTDQTGQQSALVPLKPNLLLTDPQGFTVSDGQTLMLPANELTPVSTAVQHAASLTAHLVITPHRQMQEGWIMAIADADREHLNLAIAQDKRDLIIQIRTPATGEHATPALIVQNVITDDRPHAIAVTYQRGVLQVAIDGHLRPETLEVTPALAFFSQLLPFKANHVLGRYVWIPMVYTLLYTGLVFVPTGLAIALWVRPSWSGMQRAMTALGGAIVATLMYAGLVVFAGGPWLQVTIILLQITVTCIAWAFFSRLLSSPSAPH